MLNANPQVLNIKENDFLQESLIPLRSQSSYLKAENKNSNNSQPHDEEEIQDSRNQTLIIENIPNSNTDNNAGIKWDRNHPIRPMQIKWF